MIGEYQEIQEQFNKVIEYSQDFFPATDHLFEDWARNKEWLYKSFGGELIIDCGIVSFELDQEAKIDKIDEFLDYVDREYHLYDLTRFIEAQKSSFYSNETCEDYEYRGTKIPKGAKLVKSFKHFITNKELLTEIQNKASMVIQDDKVQGRLCFSIHPLDYLSISETTYKWRSCHALDGEYRAGNLSYMADSTTVVCYLQSDNKEILPHFPNDVPWNSKKWRCLLFFSESGHEIFFGRQYPMFAEGAMDEIIVQLRMAGVIHGRWSPPHADSITFVEGKKEIWSLGDRYYPVGGAMYPLGRMVEDMTNLHFNDLLKSSFYLPYISYQILWESWGDKQMPKFLVGRNVNCLCCGREAINPRDNGSMLCATCNPEDEDWDGRTYWCDYCGSSWDQDDMVYVDGMTICPECADTRVATCRECNMMFLKESGLIDSAGRTYCSRFCLDNTFMKIKYKEQEING